MAEASLSPKRTPAIPSPESNTGPPGGVAVATVVEPFGGKVEATVVDESRDEEEAVGAENPIHPL